MALYDRRFGLPQAVVDYLNQGLPNIYQSITQPSIAPTTTQPVVNTDQDIIENLYPKIGGGGDSYSVYNPDPSTISNREYSPYAYRQAMAKSGAGIPSGILSDSEFLYGPQLTGIPGAAANYLQNSYIGKGLDYLGNIMPVNRRAILENELAGQGIMVNDIGQIVSDGGNINTAQNIMAGYNANKIDASTFQKRRDMINEKMKDPIQKAAKLKALDEAEARILGTATDRATAIFDDQSLAKDPTYQSFDDLVAAGLLAGDDDDDDYEFDPTDPEEFFKFNPISRKSAIDQEISNRNAEREIEKQNQERIARETRQKAEAARKNQTYTGGSDRQNVVDRNTGRRDATGGDIGSKGASDQFSNKSGRGRTGY